MKKKKSNGMVLITTMLFISIIIMIATLIAVQGKAALQNGSLTLQTEEAYLTALSGIEYVRGELRKSQTFGTKSLALSTPPTIPGLIVEYNDRNITGYLGADSKNSYKSKFLISFANPKFTDTTDKNYKHTSSGCKYISVNNMNSSTDRTTSDIKLSIDKKTSDMKLRRNVPAGSIYVVSKGVCGKAVRYAEAFLISDSSPSVDGGSAIGGNVTITGTVSEDYGYDSEGGKTEANSLLTITHVDTNKPGKLIAFDSDGKANNNIKLTSGSKNIYDLLNLNNKVIFNGTLNGDDTTPDPRDTKDKSSNLTVNPGVEIDKDDLNSLDYQEAKNYVGECSYELTPGTYLYIRNIDITQQAYWKFFPVTTSIATQDDRQVFEQVILNNGYYDQYVQDVPSNCGITFGSVFNLKDENGEDIQSFTRTVNLHENVHSNGNVSFAIVEKQSDGTYKFVDSSVDFKVNGGSLVSNKDIYIDGEVVGHGSLVSNRNITFNAGSNLEVDPNQRVTIWANGDINIKRATNLSNDSLVQIFQDEYNLNNGNSNTSGSDTTNVNPVSEIQINRLLTGVTGDKVREEVVLEDLISDWGYKDGGSNFGDFVFKYNGHHFKIRAYKGETQTSNKIEIFVDKENATGTITADKTIYDQPRTGHPEDPYFDSVVFTDGTDVCFTRRWGAHDSICNDFNIFIEIGDKYYLYKSINVNTSGDGAFGSSLENSPGIVNHSKCGIHPDQYGGGKGNLMTALYEEQIINNGGGSSQSQQPTNTSQAEINTENALITSIVNSDTKLKGTVYSREGSIDINSGTTDFEIIGALITLQGNLDITAGHINIQYDPKYVPFFKDSAGIKTNVKFLSSFIGGE